jgi:hypothetical protein
MVSPWSLQVSRLEQCERKGVISRRGTILGLMDLGAKFNDSNLATYLDMFCGSLALHVIPDLFLQYSHGSASIWVSVSYNPVT